jgi:hypothetical protein
MNIHRDIITKATDCLSDLFGEFSLVTLDRFSSAGRTIYATEGGLEILKPHLSAGYYDAWEHLKLANNTSIEARTAHREAKSKYHWLDQLLPHIQKLIQKRGKKPILSVWFSSAISLKIANEFGGIEAAISETNRLFLENKTNLNLFLGAAGVSPSIMIPSLNVYGVLPSYKELEKKFGDVFIVQSAHSSGGKGTHFIKTEHNFHKIKNINSAWKVSAYIEGTSSNVTILSLPNEQGGCSVFVDIPSHKGTNSPIQGIYLGKSAGNEWSQPYPQAVIDEVINAAIKIGHYAFKKHGLSGIWGIDLIIGEHGVKINEINPRLQGTTELSSINQMQRGLPPFLAAHIAHFGGKKVDWMPNPECFNTETARLSTATRTAPFYMKLRNSTDQEIFFPNSFPGSGIYKISEAENKLIWNRQGASAIEANLDEAEILLANAPSRFSLCAPNAEMGTIEGMSRQRIFSEKGGLTELGQKIVLLSKKHFGIGV